MRALITGISGFVGANLARYLLEQGVEVHGLARTESKLWRLDEIRSQLQLVEADLTNGEAVSRAITGVAPDVIFHLATYGAYHYQSDPAAIFKTTLEGTLNVLEAAKAAGVGLVVSSGSSSEYGSKSQPMREDQIVEPNSFYAIAKAAQTALGHFYATERGLPTITLRLFSVFGPYEEPGRFMPTAILKALRQEPIPLAAPETARDFIYVEDVSRALWLAAGHPELAGQTFNLGTGHESTLKTAIDAILDLTQSKSVPKWGSYPARAFDTDRWVADMAKTQKYLGFTPAYSLADGLGAMVNWLRDHSHFYDQT